MPCKQSACVNVYVSDTEIVSWMHPLCILVNNDNTINRPQIQIPHRSYLILNPGGVAGVADLKKAAEVILLSTGLDPDTYRIGNTKA